MLLFIRRGRMLWAAMPWTGRAGITLLSFMAMQVSVGRVQASTQIYAPIAPLGTAQSIGMGNAEVAVANDAGAVTVNPAAIGNVGMAGGTDVSVSGGDRAPNYFGIHVFGQSHDMVPGALWGAILNGPLGQEKMLAYTTGASANGIDLATTVRYEWWSRQGVGDGTAPNVDVGVRYPMSNGLVYGLSGINLIHSDPFRGSAMSIDNESQVIGGIGYTGQAHSLAEIDYVYTQDHQYVRFGGQVRVAHETYLRAGLSDKDISGGVTFNVLGNSLSLAAVFPNHQRALFVGGYTTYF